jgi:hypothetical protein
MSRPSVARWLPVAAAVGATALGFWGFISDILRGGTVPVILQSL